MGNERMSAAQIARRFGMEPQESDVLYRGGWLIYQNAAKTKWFYIHKWFKPNGTQEERDKRSGEELTLRLAKKAIDAKSPKHHRGKAVNWRPSGEQGAPEPTMTTRTTKVVLVKQQSLAQKPVKLIKICEECETYPADPPSKLCAGCQAYREHQQ